MKTPICFTPATRLKVLVWLGMNVKPSIKDSVTLNQDAWIREVFYRVSDRIKTDYELSAYESIDGTPKLLSFDDSDFEYEEID